MGLRKHAKGQKPHGKADDASGGEGRQPHFVKNFTKSPWRVLLQPLLPLPGHAIRCHVAGHSSLRHEQSDDHRPEIEFFHLKSDP